MRRRILLAAAMVIASAIGLMLTQAVALPIDPPQTWELEGLRLDVGNGGTCDDPTMIKLCHSGAVHNTTNQMKSGHDRIWRC